MGRGSGTTRGGNASNPRGLSRSKSEIGMPNESIRSGIGMSRSGAESLQQVRERYNKALDDAVKYYNSAIDYPDRGTHQVKWRLSNKWGA